MSRVLVVEDEPNVLRPLADYLRREKLEVLEAVSLKEARMQLGGHPRVVVLDWMLPDGQGVDFLRDVRRNGNSVPVIMLTARHELIDKVLGLELGANDYVTKPFEPRELLARIHVQLRSRAPSPAPTPVLDVAGIHMDLETREVAFAGSALELTKMEFSLLKLLMENPGRVFSREELLNRVWGFESYPTTRTIDTHILQLRQKFGAERFETVRGIGYRLVVAK
ncbi:MAG: response regulator transcription factor [Myxococcota bacterium]